MSDSLVEARWRSGSLRFEAEGRSGISVVLDGDSGEGPSPPETLLISLAACMGVDVVEILNKMRVPLDALVVRVEADRRPEPPRRFTAIRMLYRVEGVPAADHPKLERAVTMSRETYCSVLHTLRPDLDLAIRIETA